MLFFEIIQVSLGTREKMKRVPTAVEWRRIYRTAEKQAVIGTLLSGIDRLSAEEKPPRDLLIQWIGDGLQIETKNKALDNATELITRVFKDGGVRSCVLKGQGIARLYPQPERRQAGDIDLWAEGGRVRILEFLRDNHLGTGKVLMHHVEAHIVEGADSEIHFIPVYACNPFLHHRLQRFFNKLSDAQYSNYNEDMGFSHPTLRFNAVYVLAHIYMHFLYEGIGLRQFVGYYYVLSHLSESEREQARIDIKAVGLNKFAGAVMYVLRKVCRMDSSLAITKVDKKRGTVLLTEIMLGGNFGGYDKGLRKRKRGNLIGFNMVAFKRQLRFVRYYPMDVLFIPFFKVWHWCWRKWKGYL